jgi:hypothetical protein
MIKTKGRVETRLRWRARVAGKGPRGPPTAQVASVLPLAPNVSTHTRAMIIVHCPSDQLGQPDDMHRSIIVRIRQQLWQRRCEEWARQDTHIKLLSQAVAGCSEHSRIRGANVQCQAFRSYYACETALFSIGPLMRKEMALFLRCVLRLVHDVAF